MKPGTKPNYKKDKMVKELRNKKLSFRQIGKLLDEDVKSVYRRYKRVLATYPQKIEKAS